MVNKCVVGMVAGVAALLAVASCSSSSPAPGEIILGSATAKCIQASGYIPDPEPPNIPTIMFRISSDPDHGIALTTVGQNGTSVPLADADAARAVEVGCKDAVLEDIKVGMTPSPS